MLGKAPSNAILARVLENFEEVSCMAIDPVCGMEVVDEDKALKVTYEGRTYYFCSEDCRDEFNEAPDEYTGQRAGVHFEEDM